MDFYEFIASPQFFFKCYFLNEPTSHIHKTYIYVKFLNTEIAMKYFVFVISY